MTPLQLATLALYFAALAAAVALAGRDRRAIPVFGYLGAVVAIDLLQLLRAALLPPATGIRTGWELVLRQAEVGLYLGSILALPAMAVALFSLSFPGRPSTKGHDAARLHRPLPGLSRGPYQRAPVGRRPYPGGSPPGQSLATFPRAVSPLGAAAVAWLLLTAGIAGSYPDLRGAALLRIYDLVELGAVAVSLAVALRWIACHALDHELRSPAHLAGLALIAGPAGSCVLPWLTRDTVLDGWPCIVAGNAVAVATCLVLLLWGLSRGRRRPCTS